MDDINSFKSGANNHVNKNFVAVAVVPLLDTKVHKKKILDRR